MPSSSRYNFSRHSREMEGTSDDQGWYAEQQGELIALRGGTSWTRNRQPPRRTKIVDFSSKSRMRLLKLIARIDWLAIGQVPFITLTYPDERKDIPTYMRTAQRWAVHNRIEEWAGRQIPQLWRVEWKPRLSGACKGDIACHIHIAPIGLKRIPWQVIRKAWANAVHWKNPVTDIRSRKGRRAARYAAKYAAKQSEISSLDYVPYLEFPPEGRCWGLTREKLVPRCRRRYAGPLTEPEIRRAQKIGVQVMEKPHATGFCAFTPRAEILFDEIVGEEAGYLDDDQVGG